MCPASTAVNRPSEREVVFSRVLDVPRDLAWTVWSDPAHLRHWFGPDGFTTTTHEFSFVPGGTWRFTLLGPDGTRYPNRIVFREIVPPSRLVYENAWDDPGAELHFSVVASFIADGDRTRLSLHMTFPDRQSLETAVEHYGVLQGGVQTLERLAAALKRLEREMPRP